MENENIKTSRASQTRDKVKNLQLGLHPHHSMHRPAPQGYRHRWIRVETMVFDDTKNVAANLREGWELVRADEYPESRLSNYDHRKICGELSE